MRIDILVSSLRGGGAERAAAALAGGWAARGHRVRLVTLAPAGAEDYPLAPQVTRIALALPATGHPAFRIIRRLHALRRCLTAHPRAEIVVAIQANMAIEAALAAWGTGLRIIGCERNIPTRAVRGRFWQTLRPLAYRRLDRIVTQTAGAAMDLQPLVGRKPVDVVPNMLHLPLTATGADIPPATVLPDGAPCLLAVGRLVPAKGFDMLVARFAQLSQVRSDLHLVILGEGPERAALAAEITRRGLSGRIHLPGRAGNLAQWYERATLFVMTSRWEGMPMVLLEAMAHGLPPVVTDFPHGPRDVIRDGESGVILPPLDTALWCRIIGTLLADPRRRKEMGEKARRATLPFRPDAVMAMWDGVLARARRD